MSKRIRNPFPKLIIPNTPAAIGDKVVMLTYCANSNSRYNGDHSWAIVVPQTSVR